MIYKKWVEIPTHLASRTEWGRRGYKLKKGAKIAAYLESWNGMYYQNVDLYNKKDVEEIGGKKAEIRRKTFAS